MCIRDRTGIDVKKLPSQALSSMNHSVIYEIYPEWRHRYPSGVTQNTEHWFQICLVDRVPIQISPREHLSYRWESIERAADLCFSPSNQEAIQKLNSL
jgi:dATP pyrophosphohydrolase